MKPADLLRKWQDRIPPDGASCEDLVSVMRHIGMTVEQRKSGHFTGTHPALVGCDRFPQGVVNVNCHAFGVQGRAHPSGIRDIVRAAAMIEGANANEQDRPV